MAVVEHVKKPFKTIVSLVHSMVMSVRLFHEDLQAQEIGEGEAVIPPIVVESQDAVTICKTLVSNIETRITGMPIRQFIQQLSGLGVVLLIVLMSADSASANLSCMMVLKAMHIAALPLFVMWHFEPCGVHQCMRATVRQACLTRQKDVMKSQSKLLKSKHNRQAFETMVLNKFEENFDFNSRALSAAEQTERATQVQHLKDLLAVRFTAQKHVGEISEDEDKRLGISERAVAQFLDFMNNSVPSTGRWGRLDPDQSRESAWAEAKELLRLALFHSCVPSYNEARILRYMECCTFWARFHALVPFAADVWNSITFADSRAGAAHEKLRAENSVRLRRAQKLAGDPKSRCLSLVFFMCMQHIEELVHLFFHLNTDTLESLSGATAEAAAAAATNKGDRRRLKKNRLGLGSVVDAIERHCGELWGLLIQEDPDSPVHHMAHAFWPSSEPKEALAECLRLASATSLSEIIHRFVLRHRQLPHYMLPTRQQDLPSDDACSEALALAKERPCCVRNVQGVVDHARARPAPERAFGQAMKTLDRRVPAASIPAEKMHAEQRFHSLKSGQRKPTGFSRQATAHVCVHSQKVWRGRGGPELRAIRCNQKVRFKAAMTRPTYKRRSGLKVKFAYAQQRLTAQVTPARLFNQLLFSICCLLVMSDSDC